MDELVLPPSKASQVFRLIATAVFATLGVVLLAYGLVAVVTGSGSFAVCLFIVLVGALCTAMFGHIFVQTVRSRHSPGLRLTTSGFDFDGNFCAWVDVEGFKPVGGGDFGTTHIKVQYAPGATLSRAARVSRTLGRVGFYTAPAYLPVRAFKTGDPPLVDVLWDWLQRSRNQ